MRNSHEKTSILIPLNGIRLHAFLAEFLLFGIKQAYACLFGGLLLFFILITHYWYPLGNYIYRYDFLFFVAIGIQVLLLALKLETFKEARVIIIFHVVASIMEIYKTSAAIGSWNYPEPAMFKIANVPLFAGFMYSAVGSYIARVWKVFKFEYSFYPKMVYTYILAALIYVNFFSHHYLPDIRWLLIMVSIFMFGRARIYFMVDKHYRSMPLVVGWVLVSLFIWIAENVATLANVWLYPFQDLAWQPVSYQKIIAWYLLVIISFVLVSTVHKPVIKK